MPYAPQRIEGGREREKEIQLFQTDQVSVAGATENEEILLLLIMQPQEVVKLTKVF